MKISVVKLVALLVILVGVYFAIDLFGGKGKSKGLRTELVNINKKEVTKMKVTANGAEPLVLEKLGDDWKLLLAGGKQVTAKDGAVDNALNALEGVKPSRLVSNKKEKWSQYQTDSTGTQVELFAGDKIVLDMVIGKFGATGQRAFHTFVRLSDEDEVYMAENFMSFSIPKEPQAYRDTNLGGVKKDSLRYAEFIYPSDSSFKMELLDSAWTVQNQRLDSSKVAEYLSGINYLNASGNFMDEEDKLIAPVLTAKFGLANGTETLIEAYDYNGQWVVHSSENEEGYLIDDLLFDKIFIGLDELR